jgi:hypothetical protein
MSRIKNATSVFDEIKRQPSPITDFSQSARRIPEGEASLTGSRPHAFTVALTTGVYKFLSIRSDFYALGFSPMVSVLRNPVSLGPWLGSSVVTCVNTARIIHPSIHRNWL